MLLIEFVNNRLHNCVQELSALANYEPDAQHNGQLCRSYLLHLIHPAKVRHRSCVSTTIWTAASADMDPD